MPPIIKPTVGRVVWYYPNGHMENEQPNAAIVTFVHSDKCVNLARFYQSGLPTGETSVTLVQPEDERPAGAYCTWMPYQVGQAAKTDEIQAQALANATKSPA